MAESPSSRAGAPGPPRWLIAAAMAVMILGGAAPGRAEGPTRAGRVFLTFDVELEEDIEALRRLDPPAPCTLFITGQFAESFPDAVRAWSKRHEIACHTMSHPHLTGLGAGAQEEEIRRAARALERLGGSKCLGFRAPYLESDERTRRALIRLGFRYQSSHWESDEPTGGAGELLEFPIADDAGDYGLFEEDRLSDAEALERLTSAYAARRRSGRPMVVLLHPHTIGRHAEVLRRFIDHVGRDPANWGCFRDWLGEIDGRRVDRRALWVDAGAAGYRPADIVASARMIGITDLFLQAYDPATGPVFGPGRPRDSDFHVIIDEAHARGLRVHAWFPICRDPARLRSHPEWGAVDARGERSREFVCPTTAPWRQAVLDSLGHLIDSYDIDGIHLDELRLPDAGSCQCPTCRGALGRLAGKGWPSGPIPADDPDARRVWLDYRAELIRDLAETLAVAVREWEGRLIVSAALQPEGAMGSGGVELHGQSYQGLAPHLDFVVPTAFHRREDRPASWVKAVQVAGQWRSGSTPIWLGLQAFEEPGRPKGSLDEFRLLLESARQGSVGVALSSYATLFSLGTGEDGRTNMPAGAAGLVRRWSQGPPVESRTRAAVAAAPAPAAAPPPRPASPDPGEESEDEPPAGSDPGFTIGVLTGAGSSAIILLLTLALRAARRPRRRALLDLPLSALEGLAGQPILRGEQTVFITDRLQRLQAADVDRIRADAFLLRLHEAGGDLPADVPDEGPSGPIRLQCAARAGLVCEESGRWWPTPAGTERLQAILADAPDRSWEDFVEDRLEESLQVACPHCDTAQLGHWLRPTLGCPTCHRRFALSESDVVVPHGRRRLVRRDRGIY